MERFLTAGPGPAVPTRPESFNRYAYAWNDPVNLNDPSGAIASSLTCVDGVCLQGGRGYDPFTRIGFPFVVFFDVCNEVENGPEVCSRRMLWIAGDDQFDMQRTFVPPPPKPYEQMSSETQLRLRDVAANLALGVLNPDSPCWNLFNVGGQGPDPRRLLDSLLEGGPYGSIEYGRVYNDATAATTQEVEGHAAITLNDNVNGLWGHRFTTDKQRARTVLHELGHAYNILWPGSSPRILSDRGNTGQSVANSDTIEKDCL